MFEKFLLSRNLYEVREPGVLRDELFGLRAKLTTALQLTCLVEKSAQ
jgi:hypothetical protein